MFDIPSVMSRPLLTQSFRGLEFKV